jgi:uncharacterized protein (DUF427 family)
MIRASYNGAILAESERTIRVEGNHYFPPADIRWEYLRESPTHTRCPWKGIASYYTVHVDGKTNPDAAWTYPNPSRAAAKIAGHVAFWRGVHIERLADGDSETKRFALSRLLRR